MTLFLFKFLVFSLLLLPLSVVQVSTTRGMPTIALPLSCVLVVNMAKDFFEDWKRHQADRVENQSLTLTIPRRQPQLLDSVPKMKSKKTTREFDLSSLPQEEKETESGEEIEDSTSVNIYRSMRTTQLKSSFYIVSVYMSL